MKPVPEMPLSAAEIALAFNRLFSRSHRVVLLAGGHEPLYLPATERTPAVIRFTADYPRSALHEAAHWCIAGASRRNLEDYGYFYEPPPRSPERQQAFARVEARVQALEAVFAVASGHSFAVSMDDVGSVLQLEQAFAVRVAEELKDWRRRGLPERASRFEAALVCRRLSRCGGVHG